MFRLVFLFLSLLVLNACTGTSVVQSWHGDPEHSGYASVFVVGISDSQQNRRIFEKLLVDGLTEQGIKAVPSYESISSKITINRESVVNAIRGKNFDAVIVTYVVSTDSELRYHDSPIGETYSGTTDTSMMSSTLIGTRGRYDIDEIIELRHDLFDVSQKSLVWSIQTRTRGAESIDDLIVEVTDIVRDELMNDGKIAESI